MSGASEGYQAHAHVGMSDANNKQQEGCILFGCDQEQQEQQDNTRRHHARQQLAQNEDLVTRRAPVLFTKRTAKSKRVGSQSHEPSMRCR